MGAATKPTRGRRHATACVVAVSLVLFATGGCRTGRTLGRDRTIDACDYCVLKGTGIRGFKEQASAALSSSFIVLQEYDPRLKNSNVRRKACAVSVDWRRGFWSTPVWAEVTDFETHTLIMRTEVRDRGMYNAPTKGVVAALQDVAAARVGGPPLPTGDATDAGDKEASPQGGTSASVQSERARPKSERLKELNGLRAEGLITEAEYAEQRAAIIREP